MKYNKFALQNNKKEYIKYPMAYNHQAEYTDSLYDVYLWDNKEDAEKLAKYINNTEGKILQVVEV